MDMRTGRPTGRPDFCWLRCAADRVPAAPAMHSIGAARNASQVSNIDKATTPAAHPMAPFWPARRETATRLRCRRINKSRALSRLRLRYFSQSSRRFVNNNAVTATWANYQPSVVYGAWPYADYQPYYFPPPVYIAAVAAADYDSQLHQSVLGMMTKARLSPQWRTTWISGNSRPKRSAHSG